MKDVMNLTDLAVVALALGGGVVGLVMLGLWALTDIGPPDSDDRWQGSKADTIETGFRPLVGLADVAGEYLRRLVALVAPNAIGRHVARRCREDASSFGSIIELCVRRCRAKPIRDAE